MVAIIPLLTTLGRMKCYCGTFLLSAACCVLVAVIDMARDQGTTHRMTSSNYSFQPDACGAGMCEMIERLFGIG